MSEEDKIENTETRTKSEKPIKKGKPTWKPANMLDVTNKKKGLRYRWCDKDGGNVQKKLSEGWSFVDSTSGISGDHVEPHRINDGKKMTSLREHREMILMAMPEELAEARNEVFREKGERNLDGTKDLLRHEADVHGGRYNAGETVYGYVKTPTRVID